MKLFNIPVDEFTTPDPVTATETTSIDDLVGIMKTHGIRHLPILRKEKVVGIISERDVRIASALTKREKMQVQASDIMTTNPVTVSNQSSIEEVAFEMSQKKIGSVIVNDENDNLLGIFTATDALNALIEIARNSIPRSQQKK